MPSAFRDPKSLSQWIELDYFRRPRRLRRWRRWVGWITLFICLALIAWTFLPGNESIYQAGPVSPAHRMFNDDCARCHTEPFQPLKRFFPARAAIPSVSDQACISCHDGPVHHAEQTHDPHCASCHREHRGQAVLAQVEDRHCTSCHADLRRKDGHPCLFENVSSFANHPEFALWRGTKPQDPGAVDFNHDVHLRALPGADRKLVHLECADCHRTDSAGQYMLPINYEQHCGKCHPLAARILGDTGTDRLRQAASEFAATPAPHDAPEKVRAALRERYLAFFQQHGDALAAGEDRGFRRLQPRPPRVIPGRAASTSFLEQDWVKSQLQKAEDTLFRGAAGCRYCHREPAKWLSNGLPEYALPNIAERWFTHSRFSHDAHRMLECTSCHNASSSRQTSDLLIPSITNCKQCHNSRTGARTDCVECHTYHNRKDRERWKGRLKISDFGFRTSDLRVK